MDLDPEPAACLEQGRDHGARVDLMVGLDQHAAAYRRGKPGFELACLARREPLHGEAELLTKPELPLERDLLVAVDRHVQRPGLAVARGASRIELELGDERRVSRRRIAVEGDHGLLAELGLAHGSDHPGGEMRRAGSRVGIDDGHAEPGPRGSPRHRQTDDTRRR